MLGNQDTGLGNVDTAGQTPGQGGPGSITEITSPGGSVNITNPFGPVVALEVPSAIPLSSDVVGLTFPVVAGVSRLTAAGEVTLPGLDVTGAADTSIAGTNVLIDSGNLQLDGTVAISGGLTVDAPTTFQAGSPVVLDDAFTVSGGGNTSITGASVLIDSGNLQLDGTIHLSGGADLNGSPLSPTQIFTVANIAALAGLVATNIPLESLAWVETVGACFQLQISALTVDNITVENASGLAGAQWLRLAIPNRFFWPIATWHIDPVNGSDEASGTGTGANALKTCAEWTRRMLGAQLTAAVTLNLDTDIPDADALVIPCDTVATTGSLTIQGSQTVVATDTVLAGTQARNAAANQANQINTTIDLSAFVGQMLRVQGTTNYAGIIKAIAAGTCRLSELWNTSTNSQAASGGVTAGQVIEVVQTRKGPLRYTITGTIAPTVQDVRFDGAGVARITNTRATTSGGSIFTRVIVGGTSASFSVPNGILINGGILKGGGVVLLGLATLQLEGMGLTCTSIATSLGINKWRSLVLQGTTINVVGCSVLHMDGDLGQFDTAAGAIGVNLSGTLSTGESTALTFNSGRHYGSGNNATANVWNVGLACYVIYFAAQPPTQDAGNGVAIQGGNVALGSLPVNLSLTKGSAVYAL
jgi:hypothetical protein